MRIRSSCSGETPAISSAREALVLASSARLSPSLSTCRFLMPVRVVIHSSLVSTSWLRS